MLKKQALDHLKATLFLCGLSSCGHDDKVLESVLPLA